MSSTTDSEKCNGWTNYETWVCKLWMDNDEGSQTYWREQAQEAKGYPIENEYMTLERRQVYALAVIVHEQFAEQAREWIGSQNSCFTDIFTAGFSRVNWHEIAESLLEECDEA